MLGLTIRGGVATIDLSRRFESGGGSLSMRGRVAQVVFTLTRFATVRRVSFRLDGRPVRSIGGEGVIVRPPVDRNDFEDLSPVILIESPLREHRVRSPLVVMGTSNTFEARLHVDLLGPDGARLTGRAMSASSGTGTRDTFRTTLRFVAPEGALIHVTRVPLVAGQRGKEPAPPGAIAALLTARLPADRREVGGGGLRLSPQELTAAASLNRALGARHRCSPPPAGAAVRACPTGLV